MRQSKHFLWALLSLIMGLTCLIASMAEATKPTPRDQAMVIEMKGAIGPASEDYLARQMQKAKDQGTDLIVISLHTPGGLMTSMQNMIQDILASPIPVVTYVSPSGSHAASAGTFILYASHIAAMSPGTNLGAATPVQMNGQDVKEDKEHKNPSPGPKILDKIRQGIDDKRAEDLYPDDGKTALERKSMNDAAAYIRSLADLRGRNAEWAERAVTHAKSLTAKEALAQNVINIIAHDINDLLAQIDGVEVTIGEDAKKHVIKTDDMAIEYVTPDWRVQLLSLITDPNIAFVFMTLGIYGIIYEFANPGAFVPGVTGVICLLIGMYAMNILPINMAGLALLLLGIAFMTAEAFVPSFGILGIGGGIAFILGGTMLFEAYIPGQELFMSTIISMMIFHALLLITVIKVGYDAHHKKVTTGKEGMIGENVEVTAWDKDTGEVRAKGTIWRAISDEKILYKKGDIVTIQEIDGLTLHVSTAENKTDI